MNKGSFDGKAVKIGISYQWLHKTDIHAKPWSKNFSHDRAICLHNKT